MRGAWRAGFTLVELVVAVTVAGLALTAGFTALAFVQDRADHAEAALVPALSGAVTRGLLTEWLAGARREAPGRTIRVAREGPGPGGEAFRGLDGETAASGGDELIFPTTARTPLSAATTVVRLYIDRVDSTAERGLVAELSERVGDVPRRVELVPAAAAMEIRYLPDVAEAVEWLPSWLDAQGLPRAVELTLAAAPGDSLPPLLRIPLRVPLEAVR